MTVRPLIVAARHGDGYVVIEPYSWDLGCLDSGLTITIPAGTWFDVSVPRWLRWAFDPHDPRYRTAAALHDTLLIANWDRLTAGAVFAEALRASETPIWRRLIMWIAVSLYRFS